MEILDSHGPHDGHEGNGSHPDHDDYEHSHGEGRHGHQASLGDALDFVNTLEYDKGVPDDYLKDVPTAVSWLQDHALLHREMVDDLLTKYDDRRRHATDEPDLAYPRGPARAARRDS